MRDRRKPHLLRDLGGERRTLGASAEENELLLVREYRLVIGRLRIDPEFQHAARTVKRAGNSAVALKLADVADVDENHVVAAVHGDCLGGRNCFNLAIGVLDQRFHTERNFLSHKGFRRTLPLAGQDWAKIGPWSHGKLFAHGPTGTETELPCSGNPSWRSPPRPSSAARPSP